MLSRLVIRHFKLIEQLDLDFSAGAVAVTGETGAGKSSLLQALSVVLGGRLSGRVLRPLAKRGEVQAWFDLASRPDIRDWLATRDLEPGLDGFCIMRRVFTEDGRSKGQINGSACALATLSELGSMLVDLIAQNQHHSLLRPAAQMSLLDAGWDSGEALAALADGYRRMQGIRAALESAEDEQSACGDNIAFLEQQLMELRELELSEGGFEELEGTYRELAGAGEKLAALDRLEKLLDGDSASAMGFLRRAMRELPDRGQEQMQSVLEQAGIQLDEALILLRSQARSIEDDPRQLGALEQKLSRCHELARRHRCDAADLWRCEDKWQEELQDLKGVGQRREQLARELAEEQDSWQARAAKVSEERKKTARQLAEQVNLRIHALGMEGAGFEVRIEAKEPSAVGLEQVEFLYSPAPAIAPQKMAGIASGGELSRLYLAIALSGIALSSGSGQPAPLLVLDEADVGIGGRTSHRLAALVRELGKTRQLICVTHLPQVAAAAQHHLRMERQSGDLPQLRVKMLDAGERQGELARMLGGGRADRESKELAQKLLEEAAQ